MDPKELRSPHGGVLKADYSNAQAPKTPTNPNAPTLDYAVPEKDSDPAFTSSISTIVKISAAITFFWLLAEPIALWNTTTGNQRHDLGDLFLAIDMMAISAIHAFFAIIVLIAGYFSLTRRSREATSICGVFIHLCFLLDTCACWGPKGGLLLASLCCWFVAGCAHLLWRGQLVV